MDEKGSSKKSDLRASSALLLFSCTPARQLTPTQLSYISTTWNRSRRHVMPIRTHLLRFQMELKRLGTDRPYVKSQALRKVFIADVRKHCNSSNASIESGSNLS